MRTRLLASSMISGVALAAVATGAFAQDATTKVQELVVTGSRIPSPNLTSVSPVSVVNGQDFKLTGANDTIDALNQLPQVSVGNGLNNTPNPLSGSGGFTTINLRNLGTVRTLVLEDGKRLMPGDPTLGGEAADLDTIPTALIDRVDLVTGGASAVYGSDALAGVVNFIMKHNFEGIQLDAQYGIDWHNNGNNVIPGLAAAALNDTGPINVPRGNRWDGAVIDVTATIGANSPDGKGNVTAYLSYRHQDPVTQGARDFSACQLRTTPVPHCTGSSNSNFFNDENSGLTYSVIGSDPNNIFVPRGSVQPTTPPTHFNANPYEYLSRGDERYQGGFFAHYQAAPWADVYSDFSFMDDRSVIHAAPSALFQQNFTVNCDNPLLSAQQMGVLGCGEGSTADVPMSIGRRDIEGGPRIYSFEHLSYKMDVGVRGDLGDAWSYDVYGQFGRTQYNSSVDNDISLSHAQNALEVVNVGGVPTCKSVVNGTDPNCVPYNIFADGGVTPAALNYILVRGTSTGDTQEQIVSGNFTGKLGVYGIKSPWATDGVGINLGAEYRREQLDLTPDQASLSGDLSGAGGASPPVHGAFDVKELFGEIRIPLIQDMPFVKSLDFEGGYRYSKYSGSGDTNTYKLALNWQPTPDLRFRGSFQRAVRAPNVNELFTPQLITNTSVVSVDPCSAVGQAGNVATATLAQCERTGVTAAQYGDGKDPAFGGTDKIAQCPAAQCGTVLGGNPNLTPEVSKTYSVGVVITPTSFISGFNFSVDYFHIDVSNAISTFPINIAFNDCLNLGTHCDLVVRQANGSLFGSDLRQGGYIAGTNVNIGFIQTEGFDFAANYRFDLDRFGMQNAGSFAIRFDGTWTQHLNFQPIPGEETYDCAGLYGNTCGAPTPSWRHNLRLTWNSPWKFTLSGQWRFMSAATLESTTNQPLIGGGGPDAFNGRIPAYSYFDLSATYSIRPGFTLRAGINNIFDKDPPLLNDDITGSGTPNTYNNYDLLGRQVFVGLTADF